MKIYFFGLQKEGEKLNEIFLRIFEIIKNSGVQVMSNIEELKPDEFTKEEKARLEEAGLILLDKMDGIVIEGSRSNPEMGYLIALAIAHGKNILYLLEKGKTVEPVLKSLEENKEIAKLLKIQHYTAGSLERVLLEFLTSLEKDFGQEIPSIKFTLRITPYLERYLAWKAQSAHLSKADFLRRLIKEQMIVQDEEYQRYLKKAKGKASDFHGSDPR